MRLGFEEIAPKSAVNLFYAVKYAPLRLSVHQEYRPYVADKCGIEIGGPSALFKTAMPLYPVVAGLDGVNFAAETVWEGSISAGNSFCYYRRQRGRQFIADATDLSEIASGSYDFALSSNCLEHVANPIKALTEWRRVIKDGAALVLVLPNKATNFDHRRPVTKFDHLLDDFAQDVGEDDLTHVEEILALHDLQMDPPAGDLENFRKRSLKNVENRTLHHHIFDEPLIHKLLKHVGFDVLDVTTTKSDYFALATKNPDVSLHHEPRS